MTAAQRRTPTLDDLRPSIGSVIDRWYRLGMLRFSSHDDGSDDLLLRDEIAQSILPSLIEAARREAALREALQRIVADFDSQFDPDHPVRILLQESRASTPVAGETEEDDIVSEIRADNEWSERQPEDPR
jgi:hypothetical protein